MKSFGSALLLLTVMSLSGMELQAQDLTVELIETVGDSNFYELKYGTATQSVSGLEMLNLIVNLEADGAEDPEAIVDISNGWLAVDAGATFSEVHVPTYFEFHWESSVVGGIDGFDMIAEIVVINGGIGIIDNIDAKRSGLAGEALDHALEVGPVPAAESLNLQLAAACTGTVSLWNLDGQAVHQAQLQDARQYRIPVQNLMPGIYFLRMEGQATGTGQPVKAVRKVLVMH